jgi:hypothetical protein
MVFERYGAAAEVFAVLSYFLEGIPMIYSGQEVGATQRLHSIDKDTIAWGDHPFNALYARLGKFKHDQPAMADPVSVALKLNDQILRVTRKEEGQEILAYFNLSNQEEAFLFEENGEFKSFKSRSSINLSKGDTIHLNAWNYEIYLR